MKVAAYIDDPVTTTDELIPSGETSSYRSDPYALSEFALSRKVPEYVGRAKEIRDLEKAHQDGTMPNELRLAYELVNEQMGLSQSVEDLAKTTSIASMIYANKPGDGSAREQAASCQRVLGGGANIALEYATKRYRSNVINWGMLPFITSQEDAKKIEIFDYIWIPNVRETLLGDSDNFEAYVLNNDKKEKITLHLGYLSKEEKDIIAKGCLINFYASKKK